MIKTLIFDFSGVLTKKRCFPQLAENLGKQFNIDKGKIEKRLHCSKEDYLLGNENSNDFWKRCCSGLDIPYDDFTKAFRTCYEFDQEMLFFIKKLKKRFQIVLHSDNYDIISSDIRENPKLKELFDLMFFSNEIHMNKRDKRAFKYVLSEIDKSPSECIFTDDQEKNLVAPAKIGMHTIKYDNLKQLKKQLASYSINID